MGELGLSDSALAGLSRQPPGRSGDEAPNRIGRDLSLARGAELRCPPPRATCHPRCDPTPGRCRLTPLRRRRDPSEAQEGTSLLYLFLLFFFYEIRICLYSHTHTCTYVYICI